MMDIFKNPNNYFAPAQYLISDSAYPNSERCVAAYKGGASNSPNNAYFNTCLAHSRVRNEHCIGMLKMRWGSLREMRQQIRNKKEMVSVVQWIIACCVLHNMLSSIGDSWTEILDDDDSNYKWTCNYQAQTTIRAHSFRENLKKVTIETNLRNNRYLNNKIH